MSILGLIDQSKQDAGPGGIEAPSTTLWDVASAAVDSTARNYLFNSENLFTNRELDARDEKYKQLTGRDLYSDVAQTLPMEQRLKFSPQMFDKGNKNLQEPIDAYLATLRAQDPEKYGAIFNSQEITGEVQRKAKEALLKQGKVSAGATGAANIFGQLAGGVAASFADPVNLATLPIGAGMAASIFKTALVEAGANAAVEVASYPFIKKWQDELGQEYGASQFAEGVGLSMVFGGAMGAGMKIGGKALDKITLPNSAKLAEIRSKLVDMQADSAKVETLKLSQPIDEVVQALRHEERRLHIQESDLSKYSDAVDPAVHEKALAEVDAALNEGRSLNPSKIEITDEQFKAAAKGGKTDDLTARNMKEIAAPTKAEVTPDAAQPKPNELLVEPKIDPPTPERLSELDQIYQSPEFKAAEDADFEARFKDPEEKIFMDVEKEDMSVQQMRELFKEDKDFLDAISTCGLPKVTP